MQALRPLLHGYQGLGVGRVVKLSRQSSLPAICWYRIQYRSQHDGHGPHKEYFQIPGQEPKPDLTPYVRSRQQQPLVPASQPLSPSQNVNPFQTTPDQQTLPKSRGWLHFRSAIRSTTWFLLFFQIGIMAGTALITWEYLAPPFEPGSPEEEELIESVLDTLDGHPMVQDLLKNEWIEVEAFAPDLSKGAKGRHLVHHVLGGNNTQGIFMRVFHHPQQQFTMMVFFFGFGIEGWPDVVHGGIISTLLQECIHKHIAWYFPDDALIDQYHTSIDFKQPCQPGEIYAVLVPPSNNKAASKGNIHFTELQVTSMICELTGAPVIQSEFNPFQNHEHHNIGIPSAKGKEPIFATCQAVMGLVPKKIGSGQNGSAYQVGKQDGGAFAQALAYLKTRPGYKGSSAPSQPSSSESEDVEERDNDKD